MSFRALVVKWYKPVLWGLATGVLLCAAWSLTVWLIPRPAVGIIRVDSDIWAGSNALVQRQVEAARENRRIKAVVVVLDSPGGEVVASQVLFLEFQNLRREMPVVSSVDVMAASGAYYAAMGTDPIYAKPSSAVGNVGIWAYVPEELAVNEEVLTSGPFKLTGSNREEFLREIEALKHEFLETVFSQRGNRMELSRAELSQGLLYTGRDAVELGIIDHVGTQGDAVAEAARQAGIANYEVIDLQEQVIKELFGDLYYERESWAGAVDPVTSERSLPYGIYLLYEPRLRGAP